MNMPNGLAIMMKSFGVDPSQIAQGAEEFKGIAMDAKNRLENIEAALATLASNQKLIMQSLSLLMQGQNQTDETLKGIHSVLIETEVNTNTLLQNPVLNNSVLYSAEFQSGLAVIGSLKQDEPTPADLPQVAHESESAVWYAGKKTTD